MKKFKEFGGKVEKLLTQDDIRGGELLILLSEKLPEKSSKYIMNAVNVTKERLDKLKGEVETILEDYDFTWKQVTDMIPSSPPTPPMPSTSHHGTSHMANGGPQDGIIDPYATAAGE